MLNDPIYQERRQRLLDFVIANREHFDLKNWIRDKKKSHLTPREILNHPCGTACCFGGLANLMRATEEGYGDSLFTYADPLSQDLPVVVTKLNTKGELHLVDTFELGDQHFAADWLGMDRLEGEYFFMGNWSRYGLRAPVEESIAKLQRIIATGVVRDENYDCKFS